MSVAALTPNVCSSIMARTELSMVSNATPKSNATTTVAHQKSTASNMSLTIFKRAVSVERYGRYASCRECNEREM